jgi:hypothetical protein
MTKEEVHLEMVSKFGTMSRFARLAKLDRYELQKLFARKAEDTQEVGALYRKIEATALKPAEGEITPAQLKKLAKAIEKAGGTYRFCKDNPKFAEKSVYQILSGRRKRVTEKIQELFDHFNI